MKKAEDVLKSELIGLPVEVVESRNEAQKGLKGLVEDETLNMFILRTDNGEKKIYKAQSIFIFTLRTGEKVRVNGELIIGRPEERTKKRLTKTRW